MFDIGLIQEIFVNKRCNKQESHIMFLTYLKGVISEDELVQMVSLDNNTLSKVLQRLVDRKIMSIRSDDMRKRYLVADKDLYKLNDKCSKCVNNEKHTKQENGKKINYNLCTSKRCVYNADFMCLQRIRLMSQVTSLFTEQISAMKYTTSLNEELQKSFVDKYVMSYGTTTMPNLALIRNMIRDSLTIIKGLVVSSGRPSDAFREYMTYLFTMSKKKKQPLWFKDFTDVNKIQQYFTKDQKTGKVKNVELCKKYGVKCSYINGGVCKLEKSGVECSTAIQNKMGEKYGKL